METNVFTQLGNRDSISGTIAAEIEKAILNKKFPPGSKLPTEAELCDQFGVSRTSVREALQILNTHGFVSIEKGKGIFVKNLSSDSVTNSILKFLEHRFDGDYVYDLIHARQIIEPGIAFAAALKRTDDDLELLAGDIESIKSNVGGHELHSKYDTSFHMHLAHASKNKLMPLLLKPIHKLMPLVKSNVLSSVEGAKESAVIWHTKIYEAVKAQDAKGAEQAMIGHLKIAEEHIMSVFQSEK